LQEKYDNLLIKYRILEEDMAQVKNQNEISGKRISLLQNQLQETKNEIGKKTGMFSWLYGGGNNDNITDKNLNIVKNYNVLVEDYNLKVSENGKSKYNK
jgi:hypothetical protein